LENAELTEVAYFDVYAPNDNASFNGAWSNYPFFASGNVIISSIEGGLFTVKRGPIGPTPSPTPPQPTTSPAPVGSCRLLQVVGKTDDYPAETDWKVFDANNNIVLEAENLDGDFSEETCLDSGDYTFKITDSFGDGMCCTYGEGFYKLILEGTVIKEGGEFASEEEFAFTVAAPSPVVTPTSPPVAPPTSPPVAPPTSPPVAPPTGACDIPMRMGMWTDNSNTIEYRLSDENDNLFENTNVGADMTYFEEECLELGSSYTFEIADPDGLCCNNGFGFANLNVNGNMKVITKFTGTVTVQFEATLGDISFSVSSVI